MSNNVFKSLLSVYFLRATNNASVGESIRQYFQCNVIKLWSIKQKMTYLFMCLFQEKLLLSSEIQIIFS